MIYPAPGRKPRLPASPVIFVWRLARLDGPLRRRRKPVGNIENAGQAAALVLDCVLLPTHKNTGKLNPPQEMNCSHQTGSSRRRSGREANEPSSPCALARWGPNTPAASWE